MNAPLPTVKISSPNRRVWCLGVVAAVLTMSPAAMRGQDGWKKGADRGNRFEAVIAEDAANPEWELLSFTAGRLRVPPSSVLRVAFYLPQRLAAKGVSPFVLARELEDSHHYRMESKPSAAVGGKWNVFGPWETAAVIDGIPDIRDNLGVVVLPQRSLATATDVLPAVLSVRDESIDRTIVTYRVVMRSSRTASSLAYWLERTDPPGVTVIVEKRLPGDFIRGEPIVLDLPAPEKEGRYRLAICATPLRQLPGDARTPGGRCPDRDIERTYTFDHVARAVLR